MTKEKELKANKTLRAEQIRAVLKAFSSTQLPQIEVLIDVDVYSMPSNMVTRMHEARHRSYIYRTRNRLEDIERELYKIMSLYEQTPALLASVKSNGDNCSPQPVVITKDQSAIAAGTPWILQGSKIHYSSGELNFFFVDRDTGKIIQTSI